MSAEEASRPVATLDWTELGGPINRAFDDIYFSLEDGAAETDYVFIEGCGLPSLFEQREAVQTAELGFGLGLTTARLMAAWRAAPNRPRLRATSFEIAPAPLDEMRRALGPWPGADAVLDKLAGDWPPKPGRNRYWLDDDEHAELELFVGDANALAPAWRGAADAWFLDGFSPAKNPELWGAGLMRVVFERTRPGGVFATYAAAGHVRRALISAGFDVARRPGFGRKREMLCGRRPDETT